MTTESPSKARERALRALDREARYFREQAALEHLEDDVRGLWLALADQVDRYLAVEQGDPSRLPDGVHMLHGVLWEEVPPVSG